MQIDMDHVVIAALIVVVMLVGMRLLYGYWPWQEDPHVRTLRKLAQPVHRPDEHFNFQPVPLAKGLEEPDPSQPPPFNIFPASSAAGQKDHYDRGHNDNGETQPQRNQQEGLARPEENEGGKDH
jgi:hypothetical protein